MKCRADDPNATRAAKSGAAAESESSRESAHRLIRLINSRLTTFPRCWFQERGRICKSREIQYIVADYTRFFLNRPAFSSKDTLATSFNTDHQSQISTDPRLIATSKPVSFSEAEAAP
ncbi:uncharacterized protein N7469_002684 [Penicillium citrinum]|uniref:Uncharacterized protein n=2 Tax=Penicillium TaxID=5073 RepID=A0A9W9PD49_PENCI|nr:uncharacterized protein N7469_002684 [Penicillium citrinum]KAJ5241093.1 hypothetical protein N7469_002684 [Penicillium citrinum]KAJ5586090.1 hypothetical protein N7450_005877 [Penicillium hetheringtonii]KAK5789509.1 hypothetical protein VI817_008632 [Penicillium citrinum]